MINSVNNLIEKINELPGIKLITITVEDSDFIYKIGDTADKNNDAYSVLIAKLARGIAIGGGLTVVNVYNDKKVIYGVALGENAWVSIPAGEMKKIHNIDHETRDLLPDEPDVDFCDFY